MRNRSVKIWDRRVWLYIEDDFWNSLKYIAQREHMGIGDVVRPVWLKGGRGNGQSLASAVRCLVLNYFRALENPTRKNPVTGRINSDKV